MRALFQERQSIYPYVCGDEEEIHKIWEAYRENFLNRLSEAECVALSKILGRSLLPGDFVFSVSELQAALNETRFCGVEAEALVERYFEEKLVSNSRKREEKKACNNRFWEVVLDEAGSRFGEYAVGTQWLKDVREQRKYGYHLIIREREKSSDCIKEVLMKVCGALTYLSREDRNGAGSVRLAVLGAEVTKNLPIALTGRMQRDVC